MTICMVGHTKIKLSDIAIVNTEYFANINDY